MRLVATVLLALLPLGGGFGEGTATATPTLTGLEVSFEVEVGAGVGTVVAHLITPGQPQETATLGPLGGGRFGGTVESARANIVVVFEAIQVGGGSELSGPFTLLELGVAASLLGLDSRGEPVDDSSDRTAWWVWVAVAFGAAALALIAFWAIPEKSEGETDVPQDGEESEGEQAVAGEQGEGEQAVGGETQRGGDTPELPEVDES